MNCKELQEYISAGKLDDKLKELYVDDSLLGEQKKRYLACVASFE